MSDARLQGMIYEAAGAAWRTDVLEPARSSLGRVRKAFGRALELRRDAAVGPLGEAAAAQALGTVWARYDNRHEKPDVVRARTLCSDAVSLRHLHARGSFEEGYSRLTLALLLFQYFPAEARESSREASEAVTILERTAPGSHTLRMGRAVAGLLAGDLGDHRAATHLLRLAASPARHTSVDSDVVSMAHFGDHEEDGSLLASMARSHLKNGNLAGAAAVLRIRTVFVGVEPPVFPLVSRQQNVAGSLSTADILQFARTASAGGNTRTAAAFYRQLLSTFSGSDEASSRPTGSTDIVCLASAELVALGEGSQADNDRVSSGCEPWDSPDVRGRDPYAELVLTLARANRRRGDWATSARQAQQVVSARRASPSARWLANALWTLGDARCAGGQPAAGTSALVQAVGLFKSMGGTAPAEMLTVLGQCERDAGNSVAAERWLRAAISNAEKQSATELTSYLVRAFESSTNANAYSDLASLLVRAGRVTEAFQIVEAGRARSLRRALSEKAVPKSMLADWAQHEQEQDQGRRGALWQEVLGRLLSGTGGERHASTGPDPESAIANPGDGAGRERGRPAIPLPISGSARAQRRCRSSGRRGFGRARGARAWDGPAWYSVGRSETTVFVLNAQAAQHLTARTLPLSLSQVADAVAGVRRAIESRHPTDAVGRERSASDLYDALIGPVENLIVQSARVLIVADGPLAALPFAALVRHRGMADEQYFIEWKPLLVAPSAATYVLLRDRPRPPNTTLVVAVGNPAAGGPGSSRRSEDAVEDDGAETASDDLFVPRTSARGGSLPGAAEEVRQIASLEGASARVLLAGDATESRVRALLPEARVLHFATHAVVNQTFLLDSGLRLADPTVSPPPYQDNGLLQAWEITEQLDLKADLVTLSACESATGVALPGEGAMSIGRAFHAAGARSVVSALWPIDDKATATFMTRFYAALHGGSPKVEALRQAQLSFIHSEAGNERLASPLFWAAFQLSGDWQ